MTENIPQTSASDRIEQARRALDAWLETPSDPTKIEQSARAMYRALRALITPPSVGEAMIDTAADIAERHGYESNGVDAAVLAGIEYGIQYTHERWEPADRPSQEQMLRWLGVEHMEFGSNIHIPEQDIDREEI